MITRRLTDAAHSGLVRVRRAGFRTAADSHRAYVRHVYSTLARTEPDATDLDHAMKLLGTGTSRAEVVVAIARRLQVKAREAKIDSYPRTVRHVFRRLLDRDPGRQGIEVNVAALVNGMTEADLACNIAESEEFALRLAGRHRALPALQEIRPGSYGVEVATDGQPVRVFHAQGADDFDWLEARILEFGYYELPNIWAFDVDADKKIMAEMLSLLGPGRALELGCSTGAVLKCLQERGVDAEGVEISRLALRRALPEVRANIHVGDLLGLDLAAEYDLVFGLDIFEHLNGNRLDAYLDAIARLLPPGGLAFANIPVVGSDPVFGESVPLYLESMKGDIDAGHPLRTVPVDETGYPLHGHLIWAGSDWWVERWEAAGLRREPEIEKAIHVLYDPYFEDGAHARKSFYVFSKELAPARRDEILLGVRDSRSAELDRP